MAYDFHSHILPGIDDGSRNTAQSVAMLKMLKAEGVSDVVATPHFYMNRTDIPTFLQQREEAYAQLTESIRGMDLPAIHKGAEVMLTTELAALPDLERLCIENTNYILIELPYAYWSNWVYQSLYNIICDKKLIPVIAHIDRYFAYIKRNDVKIISKLLTMNVKIQLNTSALTRLGSRRRALRMADDGVIHLLGTDCHDDKQRVPKMAKAREIIRKRSGFDILEEIDENSRRILGITE